MIYNFALRVAYTATGIWSATVSSVSLPGGGNPIVVTTSAAHGLATGNTVTIAGSTGVTGLNADWPITVLSATTFSLDGSGSLTGTPAGSPTVALATLDISGITHSDPTLCVRIEGLTAGKRVIVGFEDTVNSFGASVRRYQTPVFEGEVNALGTVDFKMPARLYKGHRFGTASARIRPTIVMIDGSTTATISAWVEA